MRTRIKGDKLMQTTSTRHHRQHRHLLIRDDLQQSRPIRVDEPLETLLDLGRIGHSLALDAHGAGKLDEVRVRLVGMGVPVLVEEVLPLRDHPLLLVVEDDDLDADVELRGGGQLRQGHVERGVAVDVDDEGVGLGDLGPDRRGQAVPHRAEPAGGDHRAGMSPAEVLGGPHLVLPHAGRDVRLVLAVGAEVAQLLDERLRLDEPVALGLLVVRQRPPLLPGVDLGVPRLAVVQRAGLDVRQEQAQVGADVADDRLGGLHDLVDVLGHDLKLHDAAAVLGGRGAGARGELADVEGHAVVEASAEGDDEVRLLHGHVGVSGSVHAEHVQGLVVELVEAAETLQGGGHGDGRQVGELLEQLGPELGLDDALAGVDDRLLGHVDEPGDAGHRGLELLVVEVHGVLDGRARQRGDRALRRNRPTQDAGRHVLGQVDEDGTGPAGGGDLERLVDAARKLGDVLDHDVPLGAGPRDAADVGLLEGVAADTGRRDLAAEDDHRRAVEERVLHGGHDVGRAGTGRHEDDARLAGCAGVAFGHVAGALLVPGEDEVEVRGVVDGIKDGENGAAGVSNCMMDSS